MATFFADLGKKYRDLLAPKSKVFDVTGAEVQVKASNYDPKLNIEATTKLGDGSVSNKIVEKVQFEKYGTAKLTLDNGKSPVTLEFESKKLASDRVTLKAKGTSLESGEVTTKVDYDPVAVSIDVKKAGTKDASDLSVIPAFAFTRNAFNAGAEVVVKPQAEAAVESFAVAAQYAGGDWVGSAKFSQNLAAKEGAQTVLVNGVYKLNSKATLGLEAAAPIDAAADKYSLTLGGKYQFDSRLSLLAKVNQTGQINAVVTQNVSKDIQLALAAKYASGQKLSTGVKITLGEY